MMRFAQLQRFSSTAAAAVLVGAVVQVVGSC
jgi:hypothetical protein